MTRETIRRPGHGLPTAVAAAVAAIIAVAAALPGTAAAQDPDPFARGPSQAGPAMDSLRIDLEWNPEWRHFRSGDGGARLFIDIALAGRPTTATGNWGLAAHVEGLGILDEVPMTASGGHALEGGLTLMRYFRAGRTALGAVAEGYYLPDVAGDAGGVEVGLKVTGLEWAWSLQEVYPKLTFGVYRDIGRFDAFRADAAFDLGFGVQNIAPPGFQETSFGIEADLGWSDYDFGEVDGTELSSEIAWSAGINLAFDRGAFSLGLRGGVSDPHNTDLVGYAGVAVRWWPDAAGM